MSKSLRRVELALSRAGIATEILEMPAETRTAAQAAAAAGCQLDQIAKSVIFRTADGDQPLLFLTAGGNRVDAGAAARAAGCALAPADAAFVRAVTGFAIGGVAPVGHLAPPRAFMDPRLLDFDLIWAAAGTPRHVFSIAPDLLRRISGAQVIDFTSLNQSM